MKRYVVGFLFDDDVKNILLIRKNRPEWQAGKFNGVGGRIEQFERPLDAMAREFYEEAGDGPPVWEHVCTLRFPYAEVEFFAGKSTFHFNAARTRTDEEIIKLPLDYVFFSGGYPLIENILPLVHLSIQRLSDRIGVAPVAWQQAQHQGS